MRIANNSSPRTMITMSAFLLTCAGCNIYVGYQMIGERGVKNRVCVYKYIYIYIYVLISRVYLYIILCAYQYTEARTIHMNKHLYIILCIYR